MTQRPIARGMRLAPVIGVLAVVGLACASPEDQLRNELAAEGVSGDSVDCVMDAFEEAGIDLDNPSSSIASANTDAISEADCMSDVFEEMFAEGLGELEVGLEEAFEEGFAEADAIEPDNLSFDSAPEADLPALSEACTAGDNRACDELWLGSPIGSPEEQLAESCGGRSTEARMGSCEFWLS